MGNFKCSKCGEKMNYVDLEIADTDLMRGELWVVEQWECSCCKRLENIQFCGKIEKVDRNV